MDWLRCFAGLWAAAALAAAAANPATPPVPARGAWPVFRGDAALSGAAAVTISPPLRLRWRFTTGGEILSSAVIRDSRIFIGSTDKNLHCLSLEDGRRVW